MIPAPLDIVIKRGDTFRQFFRLRFKDANGDPGDYPDLTTWGTGASQVRLTTEEADPPLIELVVTKANQALYPGGILLSIPSATTRDLPLTPVAVWDFEIENDLGETDTYLAGAASVVADVTRETP